MENAWTCDMQKKLHHGLNPNPILAAHNQLHISKMHDNTIIMLMWCNAWDFKIKSLKPIPKLQQKLNNFEKPQILGFKTWNAWIWEIRSLPSEEKLKKAWRNLEEEDWSEWERFWEKKRQRYRERDRQKRAADCTRRIYRPSVNLDRWRCQEVSRNLSR